MNSIILWVVLLNRNVQLNVSWEDSVISQFPFIIHCHSRKIQPCVMEMVLVWVETGHPNLISSICAWSKNGPQNWGTAGGSLGAWGLPRGSFLYGKRGRGNSRVWPWTKTSRLQWCHHNENILCREWTRVYTTTIARARVGHQCMTLIWEEALPRCSGWMRRMRPVLLGGQRPQMLALRFFFLKRSIRENRKSIHLFLSLILWIEHYFVPMPFIEIQTHIEMRVIFVNIVT